MEVFMTGVPDEFAEFDMPTDGGHGAPRSTISRVAVSKVRDPVVVEVSLDGLTTWKIATFLTRFYAAALFVGLLFAMVLWVPFVMFAGVLGLAL